MGYNTNDPNLDGKKEDHMTNRMQSLVTRLRAVSIALALAMVLVSAVVVTKPAEAQTLTVLYTFTGGADGGEPYANLIQDAAGNLYGTTSAGGASGEGTVFMLDKTGTETVLYSFCSAENCTDGANPVAGLIRDTAGNLHGTTVNGGASGYGTVFKVAANGKETVLYSFCSAQNCTDGANPYAGLIRDAAGNDYGTTEVGGSGGCGPGCGTVFKVDKAGKETVLHSFNEGAYPLYGYLVRDPAGNLYGTTAAGGADGAGAVFKLSKSGELTLLLSFTYKRPARGFVPYAGLVRDPAGNLYGTTGKGGVPGPGTVFKLGKTGKEIVLHGFNGAGGDGARPYAGLIRDAAGTLYGTTYAGGASGYGTVFKVDKTGKETVLYSFTGGSDGAYPYASLLRHANGNIYGTTSGGGAYGYGTVFELTP
jgi:uncharacterized repeat protein (TIGR03803 family)